MIESLLGAIVLFSFFLSLIITLYPFHTYQAGGFWLFFAILSLLTAGIVRWLDPTWNHPYSPVFFHGIGLLGSAVFLFAISFTANRRMKKLILARRERLYEK